MPRNAADARSVVVEFWKKSLEAVDKTRARAISGHTIVSAVGAAFIGAALVTRFADVNVGARVCAILAAVLWLAAIALYLLAATSTTRRLPPPDVRDAEQSDQPGGSNDWDPRAQAEDPMGPDAESDGEWIELGSEIVRLMQSERDRLDRRLGWASGVTLAALCFTAASFIVSTLAPPSISTTSATVYVAAPAVAVMERDCGFGAVTSKLDAGVDFRDLEKQYVVLRNVSGCPEGREYRIPRESVLGVVRDGG